MNRVLTRCSHCNRIVSSGAEFCSRCKKQQVSTKNLQGVCRPRGGLVVGIPASVYCAPVTRATRKREFPGCSGSGCDGTVSVCIEQRSPMTKTTCSSSSEESDSRTLLSGHSGIVLGLAISTDSEGEGEPEYSCVEDGSDLEEAVEAEGKDGGEAEEKAVFVCAGSRAASGGEEVRDVGSPDCGGGNCCRNCHRVEAVGPGRSAHCRVDLSPVSVSEVRFALKRWLTIRKEECAGEEFVVLCGQCTEVVTRKAVAGRGGADALWKDVWPVYCWLLVWGLSTNPLYGREGLSYLPWQWWPYWLPELGRLLPAEYGFKPGADYGVVVGRRVSDCTNERDQMLGMNERLKLGEMMSMCDELLMPLVLCPWGCSEYYQEGGLLDFDSVYARYLSGVGAAGAFCDATKVKKVESARGDFLSRHRSAHIYKPEWEVWPSVAFVGDKGPVFMSCKEHAGGTVLRYFHLPRQRLALPSRQAESLSPAVLRTRTLKPSMPRKYSNSYRLQKCTASYCGVDTAVVSENRYFDQQSHVEDVIESRSYCHRADVRGLAAALCKKGELSEAYLGNLDSRSCKLFGSDVQKTKDLVSGATLLTLSDAIRVQKILSTSGVRVVTESETTRSHHFRQNWPPLIIHVHPNDEYGARMFELPKYWSKSSRGGQKGPCYRDFWFFTGAIVSVAEVWEDIDSLVNTYGDVRGYLLSYLSRKATGQSVAVDKKRNPFYVGSTDRWMSCWYLNEVLLRQCPRCFPWNIQEGLARVMPESNTLCVVVQGSEDAALAIQTALADGNSKRHIVVVFSGEDLVRKKPPLSVAAFGADFELRFIGLSDSCSAPGSVNVWRCEMWRRHGGIFQGWWVSQRYSTSEVIRRQPSLQGCSAPKIRFALFVRVDTTSLCQHRRKYLRYIGGQDCFMCKEHDAPLITSATIARKGGRQCCLSGEGGLCSRAVVSECPFDGCYSGCCKECLEVGLAGDGSVTYVSGLVRPGIGANTDSTNKCLDDHACDCSDDEEVEVADDNSSCSNESNSCGYGCLHTGSNEPMFDLEQGLAPMEEPEAEGEVVIPTTLEGEGIQEYANVLGTMGTSVLLNKFGTVLVRKHDRIQASRRQNNIMERAVARGDYGSIPLLWLEGMLFPSIFWQMGHPSKGGLSGAIPTAFLCQHATRNRFKIASLAEHARLRLRSPGSSASTNPAYLSYMFDCLANGAMEGQDTRVVLSRGFEESMGPAGMRMRNGDDDFYTDTIDNRQCCHNLCASERDLPSTLFVTLTCNQREHFGVRQVKRYVDSQEALENYKRVLREEWPGEPELSTKEEEEVAFALQESARNLIVRNWMEVRLLLMRYILKSDERPLGEVVKIFVRDEYQSESGNLSHLHMLVTLRKKYDSVEGRMEIQRLVRGFVDEVVGVDEVEAFIQDGVFTGWDDYFDMKEQARRILPHSCDSYRCMRRVGPGKGELKCRVPDTRKLSTDLFEFYEKSFDIQHTGDALRLYERLGFSEDQGKNGGFFRPLVSFLQSKRILAPARFGEGNITPVVGRLFAATRSSMNVQVCTSFGTSRYLVKYVTKIDQNNYVVFSVKSKKEDVFKAELVNLHNTKIASSARHEKTKLKRSRHKNRPQGRAIASTEMMQIILGYPQVHTNVEYVKVSTLPMGDRTGVERRPAKDKYYELKRDGFFSGRAVVPDMYSFCVPDIQLRRSAFGKTAPYRCFTAGQVAVLHDQVHSPVSVDRVTLFGVRPPELMAVDNMEWYFKLFDRSKGPVYEGVIGFSDLVRSQMDDSCWVDGLQHQIRLRGNGIEQLARILSSKKFLSAYGGSKATPCVHLLGEICEFYSTDGLVSTQATTKLPRVAFKKWDRMRGNLLAIEERDVLLPVVVFSNVRPKNATKFIIHLLLSMGHFETEGELWASTSMQSAFIAAKLVDVETPSAIQEHHVLDLLGKWIVDQAQYYPITSKTMDNFVCSAESILRSALLRNEVPTDEIPPCMYTKLVQDCTATTQAYKEQVRASTSAAVLANLGLVYGASGLPTAAAVEAAASSPFGSSLVFPKCTGQSEDSYREQSRVYDECRAAITEYMQPSTVSARNLVVVGPPGAGKTHTMLLGALYALCEGLLSTTTAMLAERALLLGGQHFHKLFKLKARDKGYRVHRMAELAVIALQRQPETMALLRCLDVLFVDELGQLSAELLSVLDIVMRRIRDSSLFMGGLLIIGTLDQVQLRPIKELPFLLSPYVLTCFRMTKLTQYVRCASCPTLREMNDIARFFTMDPAIQSQKLERFIELVTDPVSGCTFVPSWDDSRITDDVLRVFPRRKEAARATKDYLAQRERQNNESGLPYVSRKALDTMVAMESHGEWSEATSPVVAFLSRVASEPETVDFFPDAVYQFTFNKAGKFNATQLAVLKDMPDKEDIEGFKSVLVLAAPPGTKVAHTTGRTKEDLISNFGWTEVAVGTAPEYTQSMWQHGVKAKRKQYGLKHHVASTVHCSIGHTMPKIATELSLANGVWERAMVVVVISRPTRAKDIIFVGDRSENLRALEAGLRIRCQYDDYMNHIVDVLCGETRAPLQLSHHPYRPKDVPLPADTSGVVYLLVSIKDGHSLYVGMTQQLSARLKQHNSGFGSRSTASPDLRPWALVAYACGFQGCRSLMRRVEAAWQHANQHYCPKSAEDSLALGARLVVTDYREHQLVMVSHLT